MDQNREILHLSGADCYITEEEKSAYKVQSGRVYVYVAPLKNGKPMLRRLLCEVEEGRLIPSLRYRRIGAMPDVRFMLDSGQCATKTPLSRIRFTSASVDQTQCAMIVRAAPPNSP